MRDFLGEGSSVSRPADRADATVTGRADEEVELGLRVELVLGAAGTLRFVWRLSAGCGLPEMPAVAAEGG